MSNSRRFGILAVAIVIGILAFLIAKPGGTGKKSAPSAGNGSATQSQTPAGKPRATIPAIPVVEVKNAKPVGGIQAIKVNKNSFVRFKVNSDTADEIHIHGYDLHKEVAAGGSASFGFKATIDGEFEVELENHKQQILSLQVQP